MWTCTGLSRILENKKRHALLFVEIAGNSKTLHKDSIAVLTHVEWDAILHSCILVSFDIRLNLHR